MICEGSSSSTIKLEQHRRDRRGREARRRGGARQARVRGPQQLAQLMGAARLHPVLVGDRKREVGREHVDPRERAPRSADGVEGLAPAALAKPRLLQRGFHRLARLALAVRARIEPQHAERQRDSGCVAVRADFDQLEAPAAEVADNPVGLGDSRPHPFAGKSRFLLGAQHLAVEADVFDRAHELLAILGVADRGRRNHLGVLDLHMVDEQPEAAERGERLGPCILGQRPRPGQAGAEPGQHLFVEDRRRDPRRTGIDDEPDRVRPDVDDGRGFAFRQANVLGGSAAWELCGPSLGPGRGPTSWGWT